MSLDLAQSFFGWCTVFDYAFLLVWYVGFVLAHDVVYRLHRRWFALTEERFDAIHYAGMAIFKVGTVLFALVPWLALCLAG